MGPLARKIKTLALRQLEAAALVAIERRPGKAPLVRAIGVTRLNWVHPPGPSRYRRLAQVAAPVPILSYHFLLLNDLIAGSS